VVVGRHTLSAGMMLATEIEQNTHAFFVGEPTGSSPNFVGQDVGLRLPFSGMRGSLSDLNMTPLLFSRVNQPPPCGRGSVNVLRADAQLFLTLCLYWQSSSATDFRVWIAPVLCTPASFPLYKANRDPALDAILAYDPAPQSVR
jgi:hypothetical protein